MSDELQRTLDYEGKIDRGSDNIELLIADGRKRAASSWKKGRQKSGLSKPKTGFDGLIDEQRQIG